MSKNIILQHMDGKLRELDKLSVENMQRYAEFVKADYELVRDRPFREHLTGACQKIYMLDEKYDNYDHVLMVDIDMFARKGMMTNVFKVPGIGLYADVQKSLHRKMIPHGGSLNYPYWGGAIYKMNLKTRQTLRAGLGGDESWMDKFNEAYKFEDEGIMHILAKMSNFRPDQPYMHRKWCQCSFLPNLENAGFIHVRTKITPQGPKREKIENYYDLTLKGII
jgi:hypothetical protein